MHGRDSAILGQKLGPYYVKDKLGQGGMGAVYLATDMALDRQVALKVLLARYADDAEFVARFQREARASAKLNHPNIVQIYTVDIESDPAYMAIEYVDGESLESKIRREGPMKWQHALSVVSQVASALSCAHAAGIIHRDIKPANILIDKRNRARVTDFGIAKMMGSQTNLTGTQHTVGSPCYMSPEQCGKGEVTPASDIFSLGIMLFEMLAGKVPFTADSSLAVMKRITEEDLPPLSGFVPGVPQQVQQILNTLASRDLKFRYATAEQVLEDLRALQSGKAMPNLQTISLQRASQEPASPSAANLTRSPTGPSAALRTSLVDDILEEPTRPPVPRYAAPDREIPWVGILVSAVVVLLAALGFMFYQQANRPPRQASPPETNAVIPEETGPLNPNERSRPPLGPDGRPVPLGPDGRPVPLGPDGRPIPRHLLRGPNGQPLQQPPPPHVDRAPNRQPQQ